MPHRIRTGPNNVACMGSKVRRSRSPATEPAVTAGRTTTRVTHNARSDQPKEAEPKLPRRSTSGSELRSALTWTHR